MKRIIASLLAALALCGPALASEGGPALDRFPKERVTDMAALQNGAKLFVNYCLNCHAAAFMRYNRLKDIGLTRAETLEYAASVIDVVVQLDRREGKRGIAAIAASQTLL